MLPFNQAPQQMNLEQMYFGAVQAHEQGNFPAAKATYQQILAAAPNQIETNFQMGRLLVQTNAAKEGINYLEKAVHLAPGNIDFWRLLVEAMAGAGMRKQARKTAKRAKSQGFSSLQVEELAALAERDPSQSTSQIGDAPQAEIDQAISLFQMGRHAEAEKQAETLVVNHPKVAFLQNLLGVLKMHRKAPEDAALCFELAIECDPFFPDAHSNLAKALIELGEYTAAVTACEHALKLAPDHLGANINLANAALNCDKEDLAKKAIDKALEIDPSNVEALEQKGEYFRAITAFDLALTVFQDLNLRQGVKGRYVVDIAECMSGLGRVDDAISFLKDHQNDATDPAAVRKRLGQEYASLGEFDAAIDCYREALETNPNDTVCYRQIGTFHKWDASEPLLDQMKSLYENACLKADEKAELGFALSKAMADIGAHDQVFRYLDEANSSLRPGLVYSSDDVKKDFDAMKATYSKAFFDGLSDYANEDATPIFVLGMPRSGSTLTEQIISNHRDVGGAGEIGTLAMPLNNYLMLSDHVLKSPAKIDAGKLAEIMDACIATLRKEFPDALRVTDKLLHTFVYLGFVAVLLPNAKIVHIHRDPVDNCLSIYKNRFRDQSHRYAYDQWELGNYYGLYADLMDHWLTMFPERIIDVDYDVLVADPEPQIRKLIAELGLEWDENCLNTTSNTRRVKTLSIYQARQPIYKSSVKGWKKYEADLAVMIGALKDSGVTVD